MLDLVSVRAALHTGKEMVFKLLFQNELFRAIEAINQNVDDGSIFIHIKTSKL